MTEMGEVGQRLCLPNFATCFLSLELKTIFLIVEIPQINVNLP